VRAGHEVEVLTGTGYDTSLPSSGVFLVEGIRVRTLGIYYSPRMAFIERFWSFIYFALKASWRMLYSNDYDLVIATSTPLTVAIPALCAKWIARKPVVFEVRDVWPDAAVDIGELRSAFLIKLAKGLERIAYSSADAIVPLSTGMERRIAAKGVPHGQMTVIPNCSDLDRFANGKRSRFRSKFRCDEKFVIIYAGAVSQANDIESLAASLALMQRLSGWEWWFVGDGNRLDWLRAEVSSKRLQNVRLLGAVSRDDLTDLLAGADCGVVSFVPKPVYYENSPNKFFDYIAASLPVVFSRSSWLQESILEYECGFVGSDGSSAMLAENLGMLISDRTLARRMGRNARRLAEECFSRDRMAEKYLDLLVRVSQAPRLER